MLRIFILLRLYSLCCFFSIVFICLSLVGAFGDHFLGELRVGDPLILVLIEPLHQHLQVLIAHEVPVLCHYSCQLRARQEAIAITITGLESLVGSKIWPVAEALTQHFSLLFGLEVRSERLEVGLPRFGSEELRAVIPALRVIGGSPFDLASHTLVVGREGVTELRVE